MPPLWVEIIDFFFNIRYCLGQIAIWMGGDARDLLFLIILVWGTIVAAVVTPYPWWIKDIDDIHKISTDLTESFFCKNDPWYIDDND
jgi:hypothetical protein